MTPGPGTGNRMLDALPTRVRQSVLGSADLVALPLGTVLFSQAEPIELVHFPVTAVASLVSRLQNGSAIEISTIGMEGMTGVPVFLGMGAMSNAFCVAQIVGDAIAMTAPDFERELDRHPELARICRHYVGVLLTQVSQGVACSRLHTSTQRCARWLLMTHDRVGADTFHLTHEFLGFMLGARRASVTDAIAQLRKQGVIGSHRGDIEILDRQGLEALACECYAVMQQASDSLLPLAGPEGPRRSRDHSRTPQTLGSGSVRGTPVGSIHP